MPVGMPSSLRSMRLSFMSIISLNSLLGVGSDLLGCGYWSVLSLLLSAYVVKLYELLFVNDDKYNVLLE